MRIRTVSAILASVVALALTVVPASAQQVTGVPGSPGATTTLDGKQLPPPPPKFGGVIKESAADSKPWWPPRVVPPKGAPNVLLIMTDDQGFGVSGTFGGVIPTPALDRIAKAGLRYTHFHSTALCSPTRAALITGRNHHSSGYGVIAELSTGFPGYDSIIGPDNATFFVYYVPGGSHAPHHPPKEWIDKFKGKFDMGWNALREQIIANQKQLGVVPANAELTPWPASLAKWETLPADQKKLFARQAEVFAAYTAYTDHEIGRVIQAVEDMGKLDNTLIIYIVGDNGTSPEGSTLGTPNVFTAYNGVLDAPRSKQHAQVLRLLGLGRDLPAHGGRVGVGVRHAVQVDQAGGVALRRHPAGPGRSRGPARIKDVGGIRTQFHHIIDIAPTILEAAGIPAPSMVNGIEQQPIEGVSMAYTFDTANANVASKRTTQYFEMASNRAIYNDGWYAHPRRHRFRRGCSAGRRCPDINTYKWELYNLNEDYSQSNDLAAKMPGKLKEMQALFLKEAAKYNVLPLDNRQFARAITPRPSATAGETVFTYSRLAPAAQSNLLLDFAADQIVQKFTVHQPAEQLKAQKNAPLTDEAHRRRRSLPAQRRAGTSGVRQQRRRTGAERDVRVRDDPVSLMRRRRAWTIARA